MYINAVVLSAYVGGLLIEHTNIWFSGARC
jgi:hypothetical protein